MTHSPYILVFSGWRASSCPTTLSLFESTIDGREPPQDIRICGHASDSAQSRKAGSK